MKKISSKIILFIITFISILILTNVSKASGGLRLKNLNYDVTLNTDGSANIVEIWKISIEDTNTLFKTFEVDKSKYKEITDVKVEEIKSSGNVNFKKINQYKYHVDKNCYYALMNKGNFEIAWGAHAEDTTKTYKISYKVVDAVKNYNDCSEFYWQFISNKSEIPANYIKGIINLPKEVLQEDDLKVWAHGPLNGNIRKLSKGKVEFEVEDLEENTMLEARVVTPNSIFSLNENIKSQNQLDTILMQEQKWADEANDKRQKIIEERENMKLLVKIMFIILNVIGLIVAVVIIRKIKKYKEALKNAPQIENKHYDYYRDIPYENETPANTAFVYYFKNTGLQYNMSKIVSATILDLCMKKYISFEVGTGKKDEIIINLEKENAYELPKDETIIYELLQKVPEKQTNSFTMKEFEKYVKKHGTSVYKIFERIEKIAKEEQINNGNYDKELINKHTYYSGLGIGYIFLLIVSIPIMWLNIIPSIIASIYCFKLSSKYNTLTQKGVEEKSQLIGLKRYMEDFSMIKDKEVPELILWEKYLVYATVFGIAERVLKQLKIVYPQIADPNYFNDGYSYMYLMYSHSLTNSFINTLNHSVATSYNSASTSYQATNFSSGTGGGGGFSSGGGFGGGGGRNGRKIGLLRKSE